MLGDVSSQSVVEVTAGSINNFALVRGECFKIYCCLFVCGTVSSGRVFAMGNNNSGRLGLGDTVLRYALVPLFRSHSFCFWGTHFRMKLRTTPNLVLGALSSVSLIAVEVGYGYNLVLTSSGTVFASGENSYCFGFSWRCF